jgi:hypothetical protein
VAGESACIVGVECGVDVGGGVDEEGGDEDVAEGDEGAVGGVADEETWRDGVSDLFEVEKHGGIVWLLHIGILDDNCCLDRLCRKEQSLRHLYSVWVGWST